MRNQNTLKSDLKCERVLVKYLLAKGISEEYWLMNEPDLNKLLSKFWFEVQTQEGEKYTVCSLAHLWYGINRMLKRKGHEYDIVHSSSFTGCQSAFSDACKELKEEGLGVVNSYKEIEPKGN